MSKLVTAQIFVVALGFVALLGVFAVKRSALNESEKRVKAIGGNAGILSARPEPEAVVLSAATSVSAATSEAETLTATPHAENEQHINKLTWTFGGKEQRGWYLYVPLINRLIDSDASPTSLAFAASVARWQGSVGLKPSGEIDRETLLRMVQTWQERRRRGSSYPTPDQLVTVAGAEFYDTGRGAELRQVERETYSAYRRLLRAAIAERALGLAVDENNELAKDEKRLRIVSAFRSREYQARLRRESPHSGRAGLAVNSPHFTGRALDIYIAGEPVETKDPNRALQVSTPLYKWLVRNADNYGFKPYFYEPWHWEYDPDADPSR